MTVPDYQSLMAPVLQALADNHERSMSQLRTVIADKIGLTEEDLSAKSRSGAPLFASRLHRAVTYTYQSGLVRRPRRGVMEITPRGMEVLAKYPDRVDLSVLGQFAEFNDFRNRTRRAGQTASTSEGAAEVPPRETVATEARKLDGWRLKVFALLLILFALAGIIFKQWADPATEISRLALGAPPEIHIYTSSANIPIHLTLQLDEPLAGSSISNQGLTLASLYIAVTGELKRYSGTVLITISWAPYISDPSFHETPVHPWWDPAQTSKRIYTRVITVRNILQNQRRYQYGANVGDLTVPAVTQVSKGSYFAHLPGIGEDTIANGPSGPLSPRFISGIEPKAGGMNLIDSPTLSSDVTAANPSLATLENPSEYDSPFRGPRVLYWVPKMLTTTGVLEDVKPELEGAQIDSVYPSPGILEGSSYIWHGDNFLEPSLSAVKLAELRREGTYDFLSGIAFGTAGAAGIGLMQELPQPWRRRKQEQTDET